MEALIIIVIIGIVWLLVYLNKADTKFKNAIRLIEKKRFDEAQEALFKLTSKHPLAVTKYAECFYIKAQDLKNKGKNRESCPCEEKFDHEFRSWILKDGRTQAMKEKHLRHFDEMQCEKYQFKSRRQLKRYLKQKKIKYPV